MHMTREQFARYLAECEALRAWHDSQRSHYYSKAQAEMVSSGLSTNGGLHDMLENGPPRVQRLARIGRRHAVAARRVPRPLLGII
jgi:hypothetical protein